jgi:hypothetical protein
MEVRKARMRKYSYESMLRAVGRVLDEAAIQSFAIRDEENGLLVETFAENGEREHALDFSLGDLAELVELKSGAEASPRYERSYAHDDGTLRAFMRRHELVGAGR